VSYGGSRTVSLCEACHGKVHGADLTISSLIKDGLAKARARGVRLGGERKHDYEAIYRLHDAGKSKQEISRELDIPWDTVRKILRKRK
jgi:DNA invertase Pin-like site-specific DNA recombinase